MVWQADCKKSNGQGPDSFLLVTYYSGAFILESHKVVCDGGADVRVLFVCFSHSILVL